MTKTENLMKWWRKLTPEQKRAMATAAMPDHV